MSTKALGVRQLDHVTLVVANLEASRRFYVDILGMRQVPRPNFSFQGHWYQAGSTLIHVILEHPESGPSGNTIPAGSTVSRTHHLAFEVTDAAAAAEEIRKWGIEIVAGPKFRPDGATQFFVLDPDQYVVELFSS